jgi:hypothetical protein
MIIWSSGGGRVRNILKTGIRDWVDGCSVRIIIIFVSIVGPSRCRVIGNMRERAM